MMEHPENSEEYKGLTVNAGIEQPSTINPYLKLRKKVRRREYTVDEFVDGIVPHQTDNNTNSGKCLRDNGCQGNTGNVHVQADNKNKVQAYVDNACDCQEEERTYGIADCTQDGTCKVIQEHNRHAGKIYTHIKCGEVDNIPSLYSIWSR